MLNLGVLRIDLIGLLLICSEFLESADLTHHSFSLNSSLPDDPLKIPYDAKDTFKGLEDSPKLTSSITGGVGSQNSLKT